MPDSKMTFSARTATKGNTIRAAPTIAIISLGLAGWTPAASSQQSDTASPLEAAKNTLQQSRAQEHKDAVTGVTRSLQMSPQALKAARAGERDSLKKAGQDSES